MAATRQSTDHSRRQRSDLSLASRATPGDLMLSTSSQASTRLRLRLTGLPPQTSTLDIYEHLYEYGSIVRINLLETTEGLRSTRAEVDFQPAPALEFWHQPIYFKTRSHQSAVVHCHIVNKQLQVFTRESPLRQGVKYNDRTELKGTVLDFGVLMEPSKMMIMGRSGSMESRPKLVLSLFRKEIEIHFPWKQKSRKREAIRTFRFNLALDAELKIWQLSDHSFVLHVPKPPWYSKQLAEAIANTHSPDARLWTEEDTWARQTDLWADLQRIPEINSSPITLAKHMNDINIFRWTTFRFHPIDEHANVSAMQTFFDALRDWNVKVLDGKSFATVNAKPELEKKTWDLIDGTLSNDVTPAGELSRAQLPFAVRYQLEVCLSHGWLSEYSMTPEFFKQLSQLPETQARQVLVYVATDQKRLFDPMLIFSDIHYSKPVRAKRLPDNCIEISSATVTTTGILFNTPAVEVTNRIIRNHKAHAHRFLRVRFEDDDYRGQTRLYPSTNNKMIMIYTRVKRALKNGIRLGNVLYEFLAWGNSQLREHGVYFFAGTDELTADSIRAEMGNFRETVVAKKAARMGQCFSTTRPVRLPLKTIDEADTIPDIIRNGYTFTDGVGKISPAAAELVALQLHIKGPTPCLFQFRLGGCKGVLAVSDDVPEIDVRIRKSQLKFKSLANELEINRYAQFWQASLNRQIILCLSSLGVPTEVFMRRQSETVNTLNNAMRNDSAAINALRTSVDPNMMTLQLSQMVEAGFRESQEPFVISLLELWRAWSLKYLKEKAKIPIEEGAFVLGTVDETASLQGYTSACPSGPMESVMADPTAIEKLPEIFIQITDHRTGERRIIEGLCMLARNPSLHRGDIRVVRARNVPALHHMCDVVVMPQLGDRDLPSMCSGGDLDGDDYIVIWAKDLIPRFWNAEPFHYEPPVPKTAVGEIKTSDLIDFFHDYMQNDALGKIATAHMAAADCFDDGLENRICLELAQLHSMAVDYPKTGVPAKMERRLERPERPHFMEPRGKSYHSHKVLGRLYDEINKFYKKLQKGTFVKHDLEFDVRITNAFEPDADLLGKVDSVKHAYDVSLRRVLTQHGIQTEFELWSTFVLDHSKKTRDYKFHEEVGELSKVLKEEYYEELCGLAEGRDFDHLAPIAVAAYKLTQKQLQAAKLRDQSRSEDETDSDMPFISFPWLLQDTLIKIANQTANNTKQKQGEEEPNDASLDDIMQVHADDKLDDVADFNLTRDKLSPYLPDPLTTTVIASVNSTIEITTATTTPETLKGANTTTRDHQDFEELHKSEPLDFDPKLSLDESRISLLDKLQDSIVDATPLDVVIHSSGNERRDGSSGKQPQASSSDSADVQSKQLQQAIPPSSGSPEESQMLLMQVPSTPKILQKPPVDLRHKQQKTCLNWRMKRECKFPEQECRYAHYETGVDMLEKDQFTCYWWFNEGKCRFSDADCRLAHDDTGYYAPRPLGSSSPEKQKSPITKRVAIYNSDSDQDQGPCVHTKNFPEPLLTTNAYNRNDVSSIPQEKINRSNGQRSCAYPYTEPSTSLAHGDLTSRNAVRHRIPPVVPLEGTSTAYVNDALTVNGVPPEQSSPSRFRKSDPVNSAFVRRRSVRNAARYGRSLPRSMPADQLVNISDDHSVNRASHNTSNGSASRTNGKSNSNSTSWADYLKDLVLNGTEDMSPKPDVSDEITHNSVRDTETLHIEQISPPHDDPRGINAGESQQSSPVTNRSTTSKVDTFLDKTQPDKTYAVIFTNTLDDTEPATQRKEPTSGNTVSQITSSSPPPQEDVTINGDASPEIPTTTKTDNIFGDPLLASHDAQNEPEIDELFD